MADFEKKMLQTPCLITEHNESKNMNGVNWMMIMEDHDDDISSSTTSSSIGSSSETLSSSMDLVDDASSSSSSISCCSSSSSLQPSNNGPLFELSELMAQLPIKRGLSNYFEGKSQSFTSLSRVQSIEDLAKKQTPYSKKMKACKSYGGDLDAHNNKSYAATSPKATITKRSSRGSLPSFSKLTRRGSFMNSAISCTKPPSIPL